MVLLSSSSSSSSSKLLFVYFGIYFMARWLFDLPLSIYSAQCFRTNHQPEEEKEGRKEGMGGGRSLYYFEIGQQWPLLLHQVTLSCFVSMIRDVVTVVVRSRRRRRLEIVYSAQHQKQRERKLFVTQHVTLIYLNLSWLNFTSPFPPPPPPFASHFNLQPPVVYFN